MKKLRIKLTNYLIYAVICFMVMKVMANFYLDTPTTNNELFLIFLGLLIIVIFILCIYFLRKSYTIYIKLIELEENEEIDDGN